MINLPHRADDLAPASVEFLRVGELEPDTKGAGAVRFRPMALTAAAVVVGSAVILFDPIFQGLAIALMAGEIASLALSRMTVPIVYFVVNRHRHGAGSAQNMQA